MDIQKEREAFENHLKKMGKTDNETFSKNEDDSYQMEIIHFGWKIWQAAKTQAVSQWISVNDQLPPSDEMVLICWSDSPDIEPEKDFMDICVDTGCPFWANSLNDEPSHWMPLPKAQEQGQ